MCGAVHTAPRLPPMTRMEAPMEFEILTRVLFQIGIAGLGYVAGRQLQIKAQDLATLLIYVISPVAIFQAIYLSPADWSYLTYSLGTYLVASSAGVLALLSARLFWKDARANLLGFAGGTGNTGYFALPILFALFAPPQIAIGIFIIIGCALYEFTVGYFIVARGVMTARQCLLRIARLPILYAAALAMGLKTFGITISPILISGLDTFKGAYSVLGMMAIGITLSSFRKLEIDWKFMAFALGWKHLAYPLFGGLVCYLLLDLPTTTLAVIALMLSTPMASNTVLIANNLGVHPEKAAMAVMASTLMALVSVPLAVTLIT